MKSARVFLAAIPVVLVLGGGCTAVSMGTGEITSAATINFATLTPAQKKNLKATIAAGTAARSIQRPANWPQQRRWSPRRYFGPLYGSSPDLHLNGDVAAFLYNRFFTGHPDAAVFQKYYGSPLPSNQPTLAEAIPGTLPSNGFRDLRLGFDQLTYSSRYGGTFKLTFRSLEDFQVEYRKASNAWDIASLEMNVYLRPIATSFNPNAPLSFAPTGSVHVEFRPQGVIGYTVGNTGTLTDQAGDPLPALQAELDQTAQAMTATNIFTRDVNRFAYGVVHAAFWDEIGQTNSVTAIEISDGFFFPRTTAGRGVALVEVQLSNVRLDTESGGEEIYLTLSASHMFRGNSNPPTIGKDYPRIDDGESTGWKTVGVFPLDWDCAALETIIFNLRVREEDDLSPDDRFGTDPIAFQTGPLDCSGMQTEFNNGQFGLYRILSDDPLLIVDGDDNVEGALTARKRVSVIRQ